MEAIHAAREFARQQLAEQLFDALWARYQANRECRADPMWPRPSTSPACLQNIALSYLMLSGKPKCWRRPWSSSTVRQHDRAPDRAGGAGQLAVRGRAAKALETFAEHFKDNPLVMDQWFSVQAAVPAGRAGAGQGVDAAPGVHHQEPEQGAGIGAFAGQNLINFHAADGSGYRFLADLVIELNGSTRRSLRANWRR
jgi:aminopeptidase N